MADVEAWLEGCKRPADPRRCSSTRDVGGGCRRTRSSSSSRCTCRRRRRRFYPRLRSQALLNAYRIAEDASDRIAEDTSEAGKRDWWTLARRLTAFALGTALRRGEILALRWQDVELLDRRLHVRRSFVRGEMGEPKSRAGRRTIGYGPRTADVLEERWKASLHRSPESLSSATRSSALRSIPRRCRTTCGRRSRRRASNDRSGRGTTSATRRSHTTRLRQPRGVRPGASGSRAGDDDRALRPRRTGRVSRCRGAGGGSPFAGVGDD